MELLEGKMEGTSSPVGISTRLQKVATLAKQSPDMVFTTLAHHIDLALLKEAFRLTRKDGATGVDQQTAAEYAEDLDKRLTSLLDRFKSGTYKAPPVRRAYIPKANGTARPIGIPIFEDKVLQRAVAMVLGAVYEQDFLDCSYGFRPGRSCHQALQSLWLGTMGMRGGYVYEVDIRKFFDTLDHGHLRSFLDLRVRDGVIRRVIDKWLKAGVFEAAQLVYPEAGTPQGGVISPLLANIYLHEVLDKWFEHVVKPRLKGEAVLIRYADDFVMVFKEEMEPACDIEAEPLATIVFAIHPCVPVRKKPPLGPVALENIVQGVLARIIAVVVTAMALEKLLFDPEPLGRRVRANDVDLAVEQPDQVCLGDDLLRKPVKTRSTVALVDRVSTTHKEDAPAVRQIHEAASLLVKDAGANFVRGRVFASKFGQLVVVLMVAVEKPDFGWAGHKMSARIVAVDVRPIAEIPKLDQNVRCMFGYDRVDLVPVTVGVAQNKNFLHCLQTLVVGVLKIIFVLIFVIQN